MGRSGYLYGALINEIKIVNAQLLGAFNDMVVVRTNVVTPQALAAEREWIDVIDRAQRVVGARCLHTDFEVSAQNYAAEDASETAYAVAESPGAKSGEAAVIIGAEISDDVKRAWLRGPLGDWTLPACSVLADAAFDALLARFKHRARMWDAYIETTHNAAIAWYAARGFSKLKRNSVYVLTPNELPASTEFVRTLGVTTPDSDEVVDAVTILASGTFPGGYLTRSHFAEPANDEAITLVMREGEALLGYVYASYEPGAIEVTIDNLAVTEAARGKGVGRALLRSALHWAIVQRNAPQVALVVTEGNSNAMGLYESVGFRLLAEGLHLRLEIGD
jgi:ribosomal protein S18 acetylase RimI-like enzyme